MGKTNTTIRTESTEEFFRAILSLESVDECHEFFEDVCTVNEVLAMAQRFSVAKLLKQDKTYLEIAKETGASTATISRVNRSLNYGNNSYDWILERIGHMPDAE